MHHTILVAVAFLLTLAPAAVGRDFYVNNIVGDDAASGASADPGPLGGPLRTINRALRLVSQGDRIFLANTNAPYREAIAISGPQHRGLERTPLVIDGGGAVLDGTVTAADGAWRHYRGNVFYLRPRRLAFQQLFLAGEPLQRAQLSSGVTRMPQLEPLEWVLTDGRIFFRVEQGRLPQDYPLRHAGLQTGITLYNTEHVRIENLIVQGFQQDGINAHDLARDCQIANVECRANGRSGISVGGTSRVVIVRSNLYDNGRVQFRQEGYSQASLSNCDLDEQSGQPIDLRGGQLTVDGQQYVP